MRVWHMASWFPNRVHPQLGNFVERHIAALPKSLDNTVLHAWPDSVNALKRREVQDGLAAVTGMRTLMAYVPNRPPRRWRVERAYTRLCERLEREGRRPDVLHLHNAAEAALPAVEFAAQSGVPLVVSENWTAYHAEHGRSFRSKEERAVRKALQAAAVHLPVSEHLGRAMAEFAPNARQVVIPNVVDARFKSPDVPRSMQGALRLLHVSSLIDDHKDITGMLHSVSDAVRDGVDVVMECWGGAGEGGKAVRGYRKLVDELGLGRRVQFRGPASTDQVVEAMQEADAFVLFSRYENLPCVLLEAWMTGLPTLATDVGGVGEHLGRHEALGTLIQSGDREGLTQAIVAAAKAKASGQRPDHEAIHGYASARFTPEAVGGAIEAVYRSLV